jgi:two-component system, OmpR family, sensor kinase
VLGDRVRIRQIVDNLLANTRIHTPAGTPVNLGVETIGSDVVLSVADQGPGISSSDQARIFERFWRADPARSRAKGGTGLGLAIVASLVESQGGSIEVVSELGAGATFHVRFPLAASNPNALDPQSSK